MKMFEVGGCVRDELLGKSSNDIDFSVVLDASDFPEPGTSVVEPDPFRVMVNNLQNMGFSVFLETPEHLTVRARFPKAGDSVAMPKALQDMGFGETGAVRIPKDPRRAGLTADFVLARKESGYSDGRRPDAVEPGDLLDDLRRRDFTMNAIAKAPDGSLIDPFGGVQDINERVIRAVGSAQDRLEEDALRAVRALRFSVTLGFRIDHELRFAMQTEAVLDSIRNKIADERIGSPKTGELSKMFDQAFTIDGIRALADFPLLTEAMFSGRVRLTPTMKEK